MTLCECGCGLTTTVSKQSDTKRGYVRGVAMRYRPGHNPSSYRERAQGIHRHRYIRIAGRYVGAHVLVAQHALGKPLPNGAEVHHVDGNPENNANGNLVICQDRAYHKLLHVRTLVIRAGGDPNTGRICRSCLLVKPFDCFSRNSRQKSTGRKSICRPCASVEFSKWSKRQNAQQKDVA